MYNLCSSFVIFYVMSLTIVKYITPLGTIFLKHIKWQKIDWENGANILLSIYHSMYFLR